METLTTWLRITLGLALLGLYALLWGGVCMALLPFRLLRIRACNAFGSVAGRSIMWVTGCPLTIEGHEHLSGPAIFVSNHTSTLDPFLGMWLSPAGTVGVAKKSIIWYPFLGQLYLLSGHLRIDRSDRASAVASMQRMASYVREHGLSVFMWPEGTRARDGRLLPFKKGAEHLALQTGLPIVPLVVSGAHHAWEPKSMRLRPVPITVRALPAIPTTDWQEETLDSHLTALREVFIEALPETQRPLPVTAG